MIHSTVDTSAGGADGVSSQCARSHSADLDAVTSKTERRASSQGHGTNSGALARCSLHADRDHGRPSLDGRQLLIRLNVLVSNVTTTAQGG